MALDKDLDAFKATPHNSDCANRDFYLGLVLGRGFDKMPKILLKM